MKRSIYSFIALSYILLTLCSSPAEVVQTAPKWDLEMLRKAPATFPSESIQAKTPGIRALFYEGLPYQGKPTRVFAWIGMPKVEPGTKVPAMVLVHGGGGTAFQNWVKLWNDRGYAAISMDTCGALPEPENARPRPRHAHGGPPGWGGFDQIDQPPQDQWTYHAVADAILGHSLLREQPGVDKDRIGLTGISWGGYLTCIIAGADDRFRFAAPVYGCGFYLDTVFGASVKKAGSDQGSRWMKWWDPSHYLTNAKMPMLWVTGTNDFAYWLPGLRQSYRLGPPEQRTLAVRLRMPHGHGAAGEAPKEIAVYADSILKGTEPLPKVVSQQVTGNQLTVSFTSKKPVVKAELLFTKQLGDWPKRLWEAVPATIADGKVTATLPEGVTVFYVNLYDDRDCAVSTEHVDRSGGK